MNELGQVENNPEVKTEQDSIDTMNLIPLVEFSEKMVSPSPDRSSPPSVPVHFTVQAVVHHPMDWDPPAGDGNDVLKESGLQQDSPRIRDCEGQGDQQQKNPSPQSEECNVDVSAIWELEEPNSLTSAPPSNATLDIDNTHWSSPRSPVKTRQHNKERVIPKMELRNNSHSKLVDILKGAGAYEDGMQIDEMRNLVNVMQSSVICNQPQEDADLERALLESQLEFVGAQAGTLMNSTMIGPPVGPLLVPERSTSPASDRLCESPPTLPVHFTVRAVVHRPLNWEPGNLSPSAARKRPLSERNDLAPEVEIKRARPSISEPARRSVIEEYNPDHTPLTVDENESSENWPEVSIISLLSDEESAMESIGEMPSRHLISTSSAVVSDFSRSQQESQSSDQDTWFF